MSSRGYVLYFEGDTLIHKFDPRTKIILMLYFVALAFIFNHPIHLGIVLLVALAIWFYAKIPMREVSTVYKYVYGTLALIIVIQALAFPEGLEILRLIPPNPLLGNVGALTVDGIVYGIAISERILIIMLIGPLVIYTTPLDRLILGMIKLKVPYTLTFIMSTALNLLPSVQIEVKNIQEAQMARAFTKLETGSFTERMRAYIPLMVPLIVSEIRSSMLLSLAMSARAFGVAKKRTFYYEIIMTTKDKVTVAILIISLAILVYLRVFYGFGYYERLSDLLRILW